MGQPVAQVIERDEVADTNSCVAVCVVTSPYVPIEAALLKRGFKAVVPFYDLAEGFRGRHPLANGWHAPTLTGSYKNYISDVLSQWHDDVSRAHHLQFLAWRTAREEWSFDDAPIRVENRYFPPEVTSVLHDCEVFVDGGAYTGSVSFNFLYYVNGDYKAIIAIEPDAASRGQCEERLEGENITVLPYALAEHEGIVNYHDGLGYASQIAPTGHKYETAYPLDALELAPTFIKLHLEGAELAALKGARHTLVQHRPIVAVTVYHNEDGVWRTPSYLMGLLKNYRFLFRLHGWCGTGAVVYAIPEERYESRT